jgi:hypothetical protein
MKPQRQEYEKVDINDFTTGVIEKVQYEKEHKFKFQDKETIAEGVRFKFKLIGYEHPHYSRWMKFNYGVKSNLYGKYLVPLVENPMPDMDFEIENLEGLKVKILWSERNGFYNVETIRPANGRVKHEVKEEEPPIEEPDEQIIDDQLTS